MKASTQLAVKATDVEFFHYLHRGSLSAALEEVR